MVLFHRIATAKRHLETYPDVDDPTTLRVMREWIEKDLAEAEKFIEEVRSVGYDDLVAEAQEEVAVGQELLKLERLRPPE